MPLNIEQLRECEEYLRDQFNYTFDTTELLIQALSHTSYINEHKTKSISNERLEFLGDAVLDLVISKHLFSQFPDMSEGKMSKMRSALVNEKTLGELCKTIAWEKFLFLGKGEERNGGRSNLRLMSRSIEALIGAVFLDSDYPVCEKFIQDIFKNYTTVTGVDLLTPEILDQFDLKSRLQEYFLKHLKTLPEYDSSIINQKFPHKFKVQLKVKGKILAETVSHSKKKAQHVLAKKVYEQKEQFLKNFNNEA
jgi:ribonuclease-3